MSGIAAGPAPDVSHAWTPAQVVRLEAEWRRLQRDFAFHPNVVVVPLGGDPPGQFRAQYKVTTLAIDPAGQLTYVTACPVHVWLPPHFPHEAPVVRPMVPAFHPNVSMEWVHLAPPWQPGASLAEVVTQVGRLLAFQTYDPNAVANAVAMNWVYSNPRLVPTDPAADFSPRAGGEPLERILQSGGAAMDELRQKAEGVCERLATPGAAPPEQELRRFAAEARVTLELFAEPDVPEQLRAQAAELEEMVVSTQGQGSVWVQLARATSAARAVADAAGRVAASEETLTKAIALADAAVPPEGADHAATNQDNTGTNQSAEAPAATPAESDVFADVPPPAVVQPVAMELRRAVREAEEAVAALRDGLERIGPIPRGAGVAPGRMLARRLEREAARVIAAAEPARASGAALASLEPVLHRASRRAAAAERVAAWAEYADLLRRGDELVRRLSQADPVALQSCQVALGDRTLGPFDFELPVELPGVRLAVSNPRGGAVRVIDAGTEELAAAGDGSVAFSGMTFRPTEHTDDLRVRLEFLLAQTRDALAVLAPSASDRPVPAPVTTPNGPWPLDFWAGRVAASLSGRRVRKRVIEEHRRVAQRWKSLLSDLAALGRFKQRLATHHQLARLLEFVPRAHARAKAEGEVLARAESRLAEIAARSSRDAETGAVVVPQQFAAEYADRLAERDGARHELARVDKALVAAAHRVRTRLSKPRLYGAARVPTLHALPPLPAGLASLEPLLADAAIEAQVRRLEELMGQSLRDTPAAPPPVKTEGSA